jgi:hypothetical protein
MARGEAGARNFPPATGARPRAAYRGRRSAAVARPNAPVAACPPGAGGFAHPCAPGPAVAALVPAFRAREYPAHAAAVPAEFLGPYPEARRGKCLADLSLRAPTTVGTAVRNYLAAGGPRGLRAAERADGRPRGFVLPLTKAEHIIEPRARADDQVPGAAGAVQARKPARLGSAQIAPELRPRLGVAPRCDQAGFHPVLTVIRPLSLFPSA